MIFAIRVPQKSSYFHNSVVLIHAEDHIMCSDLINKNRSKYSTNNDDVSSENDFNGLDLWSKSRPPESEVIAIKKIMNLGRKFQSNLYFVTYRLE